MRRDASTTSPHEPDVAIVGMAGRFPGAGNIDAYWANLRSGIESISFFSDEELITAGADPALVSRPNYVPAAPILDDPALFDAPFFGYTPREARLIDPQHRLFLECAWQALEHAGYDPDRYGRPIGVYGGTAMNTYFLFNGLLRELIDEYVLTLSASDKDFLTTRVSYKLNLAGPSVTVQTACSTSLVAVHLASQSLLYGECDMALAGGVAVRVPQKAGHLYQEGSILSPDGHCRAFDARAQGTIFGSGVGIVVLKRLADAVTQGDTIHAVIKGSAINNDGAAKVSYTAPSVERQAAAMVEAFADAGVDAATISYVETHGTGTRVGDPIEVAALTRAFRTFTQERGFCAIGSVKTNIGHLDAAAGVAGLIKTVLALEHAEIPASLHFQEPNPAIDFDSSPFFVNSTRSAWRSGPTRRRAAVNALGAGGTNAHVIVEEAPTPERSGPSRPQQLLVVSARTDAGLAAATSALANHLTQHPSASLPDVAYTLQSGRKPFDRRRVVMCHDLHEAAADLKTLDSRWVTTARGGLPTPDVVFMLPGQGCQYVGMGADLYRSEPEFRHRVDCCSELFRPHLPADLRDVLYPDPEHLEEATRQLDQTSFTQPALFTTEYALAGLWSSWGLHPHALIGHSVGELTAACLAGVFSLEDAVQLVAARGHLMQALPVGSMLAVLLPEQELLPYLSRELDLAAVNGASQCVVAGTVDAVHDLERRLADQQVRVQAVRVSRAFHSAMMDSIIEPFLDHVQQVPLSPPRVPFVSNVTGTWIRPEEATNPGYWAGQLRQPVRLADGLQELARERDRVLLEVGPGDTLCALAQQQRRAPRVRMVLPSLGEPRDGHTVGEGMVHALGRLWLAGAEVDWAGFAANERRRRLPLPTYPFEQQRYWAGTAADRGDEPARLETEVARDASARPTVPAPAPAGTPPVACDSTPSREPRTPVEAAVIAAWQAVLGVPRIDVDDNFYRLGGHSILIPQVVARLNATFQIDLPLLSLMESPTVAELAECVEQVFRRGRAA